MEFEGFKSAWQKQPLGEHSTFPSQSSISRSLRLLHTSSIRDLQRSEELSRFIISVLFALVAVGASMVLMAPGAGRVAAWLFALSLLADGIAGMALVTRRMNQSVADTTLDFIRREHRHVQTRVRLERYSQRLMVILGLIALGLLVFVPVSIAGHQNLFEPFCRVAVLTAFLTLVWRRAKSRSRETCRELEHFLNELEK